MANGAGSFEVPPHVLQDLDNNPGLVRKWLEDGEFRHAILGAENPGDVASQNGFTLSSETSDWIVDRVRVHGADVLAGESGSIVPA